MWAFVFDMRRMCFDRALLFGDVPALPHERAAVGGFQLVAPDPSAEEAPWNPPRRGLPRDALVVVELDDRVGRRVADAEVHSHAEGGALLQPLGALLRVAHAAGTVDVVMPGGIGEQVEDLLGGRRDHAFDGDDVSGFAHAAQRTSQPRRYARPVPFAPGSVSFRSYPNQGLDAAETIAELRAQAAPSCAHGFDGVMTSEHHGGFAGYLPNPSAARGVPARSHADRVGRAVPDVVAAPARRARRGGDCVARGTLPGSRSGSVSRPARSWSTSRSWVCRWTT